MYTKKLIMNLMALVFLSQLFGQNQELKIKVVNPNNKGINNATVIVHTGCTIEKFQTNNKGELNITTTTYPNVIMIADNYNGNCGIKCFDPVTTTGTPHICTLPWFPINQEQAGIQLDEFMDNLSNAYGYYDDIMFFQAIWSGNIPPSPFSVPGIFSINPFPTGWQSGEIGFKIGGVLFDHIRTFLGKTMSIVTGNRYYYFDSPVGI